jgi:hypothetical protein
VIDGQNGELLRDNKKQAMVWRFKYDRYTFGMKSTARKSREKKLFYGHKIYVKWQ